MNKTQFAFKLLNKTEDPNVFHDLEYEIKFTLDTEQEVQYYKFHCSLSGEQINVSDEPYDTFAVFEITINPDQVNPLPYNHPRKIKLIRVGGPEIFFEFDYDLSSSNNFLLRHAAEKGDREIIKALLQRGVDVKNIDNETFRLAIIKGEIKSVILFLENGNTYKGFLDHIINSMLHQGLSRERIKSIIHNWQAIEQFGIEVFCEAAELGSVTFLEYLINRKINLTNLGPSTLEQAAIRDDVTTVDFLLNAGFRVKKNNDWIWQWAYKPGNSKMLNTFYDKGVDIRDAISYATKYHARNGSLAALQRIIKNSKDFMPQPETLVLAAKQGHTDIVTYLLEIGLDPHFNDNHALRWSAQNGETSTVTILLDHGADLRAITKYPELLATVKGNTRTFEVLQPHLAN